MHAHYNNTAVKQFNLFWRAWVRQEQEALRSEERRGAPLSAFWREKFEREARKSWDLFYRRNQGNFFKDRHCETRAGSWFWVGRDRVSVEGAGDR